MKYRVDYFHIHHFVQRLMLHEAEQKAKQIDHDIENRFEFKYL